MSDKVFVVLYTHQKMKKAKTWHDGTLKLSSNGTRGVLYDDKNSRLDAIHVRCDEIIIGEQLESDRYFILIEECKSNSGSCVTPQTDGQPRFQPSPGIVPPRTENLSKPQIRTGLKRGRRGFNPPRMVQQNPVHFTDEKIQTEDVCQSSVSMFEPFQKRYNASSLFSMKRDQTQKNNLSDTVNPECSSNLQKSSPLIGLNFNKTPPTSPWSSYGSRQTSNFNQNKFKEDSMSESAGIEKHGNVLSAVCEVNENQTNKSGRSDFDMSGSRRNAAQILALLKNSASNIDKSVVEPVRNSAILKENKCIMKENMPQKLEKEGMCLENLQSLQSNSGRDKDTSTFISQSGNISYDSISKRDHYSINISPRIVNGSKNYLQDEKMDYFHESGKRVEKKFDWSSREENISYQQCSFQSQSNDFRRSFVSETENHPDDSHFLFVQTPNVSQECDGDHCNNSVNESVKVSNHGKHIDDEVHHEFSTSSSKFFTQNRKHDKIEACTATETTSDPDTKKYVTENLPENDSSVSSESEFEDDELLHGGASFAISFSPLSNVSTTSDCERTSPTESNHESDKLVESVSNNRESIVESESTVVSESQSEVDSKTIMVSESQGEVKEDSKKYFNYKTSENTNFTNNMNLTENNENTCKSLDEQNLKLESQINQRKETVYFDKGKEIQDVSNSGCNSKPVRSDKMKCKIINSEFNPEKELKLTESDLISADFEIDSKVSTTLDDSGSSFSVDSITEKSVTVTNDLCCSVETSSSFKKVDNADVEMADNANLVGSEIHSNLQGNIKRRESLGCNPSESNNDQNNLKTSISINDIVSENGIQQKEDKKIETDKILDMECSEISLQEGPSPSILDLKHSDSNISKSNDMADVTEMSQKSLSRLEFSPDQFCKLTMYNSGSIPSSGLGECDSESGVLEADWSSSITTCKSKLSEGKKGLTNKNLEQNQLSEYLDSNEILQKSPLYGSTFFNHQLENPSEFPEYNEISQKSQSCGETYMPCQQKKGSDSRRSNELLLKSQSSVDTCLPPKQEKIPEFLDCKEMSQKSQSFEDTIIPCQQEKISKSFGDTLHSPQQENRTEVHKRCEILLKSKLSEDTSLPYQRESISAKLNQEKKYTDKSSDSSCSPLNQKSAITSNYSVNVSQSGQSDEHHSSFQHRNYPRPFEEVSSTVYGLVDTVAYNVDQQNHQNHSRLDELSSMFNISSPSAHCLPHPSELMGQPKTVRPPSSFTSQQLSQKIYERMGSYKMRGSVSSLVAKRSTDVNCTQSSNNILYQNIRRTQPNRSNGSLNESRNDKTTWNTKTNQNGIFSVLDSSDEVYDYSPVKDMSPPGALVQSQHGKTEISAFDPIQTGSHSNQFVNNHEICSHFFQEDKNENAGNNINYARELHEGFLNSMEGCNSGKKTAFEAHCFDLDTTHPLTDLEEEDLKDSIYNRPRKMFSQSPEKEKEVKCRERQAIKCQPFEDEDFSDYNVNTVPVIELGMADTREEAEYLYVKTERSREVCDVNYGCDDNSSFCVGRYDKNSSSVEHYDNNLSCVRYHDDNQSSVDVSRSFKSKEYYVCNNQKEEDLGEVSEKEDEECDMSRWGKYMPVEGEDDIDVALNSSTDRNISNHCSVKVHSEQNLNHNRTNFGKSSQKFSWKNEDISCNENSLSTRSGLEENHIWDESTNDVDWSESWEEMENSEESVKKEQNANSCTQVYHSSNRKMSQEMESLLPNKAANSNLSDVGCVAGVQKESLPKGRDLPKNDASSILPMNATSSLGETAADFSRDVQLTCDTSKPQKINNKRTKKFQFVNKNKEMKKFNSPVMNQNMAEKFDSPIVINDSDGMDFDSPLMNQNTVNKSPGLPTNSKNASPQSQRVPDSLKNLNKKFRSPLTNSSISPTVPGSVKNVNNKLSSPLTNSVNYSIVPCCTKNATINRNGSKFSSSMVNSAACFTQNAAGNVRRFNSPTMTSSLCQNQIVPDSGTKTKFQCPVVNAQSTTNKLSETQQDLCGELQFASLAEVSNNAVPNRNIVIPTVFTSPSQYRQVLVAALREHLNIILFVLSKEYHQALAKIDTSGFISEANNSVQSHGQKQTPVNTNPPCLCGISSKMVQVRKEGTNKGRFFFTCVNSQGPKKCKFFQWADGNGKTGICQPGGSIIKMSDPLGITSYFRQQKVMLYCLCQFSQKTMESILAHFKNQWLKRKYQSENKMQRKYFIRLSKRDSSSLYSKDDLWVISRDLSFDPIYTFLAKSVYYGPTSGNEVEVEPISKFSPSNWKNEAPCHALLAGNISSELNYLDNIQENLQPSAVPILQQLLDLRESDRGITNNRRFRPPSMVGGNLRSNIHTPAYVINELVYEFVTTYSLNIDQKSALEQAASMFCEESHADVSSVLLIHGVFGAGKSFLLSVMIMFLVQVFKQNDSYSPGLPYPWKILISSTTNVAVDRVLIGLLNLGFEDFVRVGSVKKIAKPVLPYSMHATGSETQELKDLQEMLRSGDLSASEKHNVRQSIEKHKLGENKKRLSSVQVVGVTCASCVASCLKDMKFPLVILDECSQMTEPASLFPIAKFSCEKLVLVGDPKQLDPTIQGSDTNHAEGLEQTMFDRLIKMGHAPTMLRTQYRCHPSISNLANTLFYGGHLRDGISSRDREPVLDVLPTLCFYNVAEGQESSDSAGSFSNEKEADFVVFLIESFLNSGVDSSSVGVITLYKSQMYKIMAKLGISRNCSQGDTKSILVSTVDAFQGGERDIIILSCVRTNSTGFIDNEKRTNVALTRARNHLLIVGHLQNLQKNKLWGHVINMCKDSINGLQHSDTARQALASWCEQNSQCSDDCNKKKEKKRKQNSAPDSPPMSLSGETQESVNEENLVIIQDSVEDITYPVNKPTRKRRKLTEIDPSLLGSDEIVDSDDEDLPIFEL